MDFIFVVATGLSPVHSGWEQKDRPQAGGYSNPAKPSYVLDVICFVIL